MKKHRFGLCYLLLLTLTCAAAAYPVFMGIHTVKIMLTEGAVPIAEYPKYIIPYTPISLALLFSVALMPLALKYLKKWALTVSSLLSTGVFLLTEHLLETRVLVQTKVLVSLQSWQLSLCYVPPESYSTRTWEAVDILLGGYDPSFKIHFYLISLVLILTLQSAAYGWGKQAMARDTGHTSHEITLTLILQSAASLTFLGLCIWACFTSFYRTGELTVPAISAVLMSVFFVLLGVTMGIYVGSFTLGRSKALSCYLPAAVACIVTLAMYLGEMALLSGHLYRLGSGFLFAPLPYIVLSAFDCLMILLSGALTALSFVLIQRKAPTKTPIEKER